MRKTRRQLKIEAEPDDVIQIKLDEKPQPDSEIAVGAKRTFKERFENEIDFEEPAEEMDSNQENILKHNIDSKI